LLLALASPAFSQTWLKVATEADTLTTAVPITVRYGTASGTTTAGVNCATANCWAIVSLQSASNLSLNDASCCVFGVADPAPGVAKELDVQEGAAAITITVSGKSVMVPALPPTTYPPIAFTPNVSYTLSVANIPPSSSTAPLAASLTIQIGTTSVPFTCTYGTTLMTAATASTPAAESAVFNCIPAPIPTQ